MKKFFALIVSAFIIVCMTGLSVGHAAAADPTYSARDQVCRGVSSQAGASCPSGGTDLTGVIKGVLRVLSTVAGIAAIIMIIVAGLRYITSNGEASEVSGAKRALIYAVVGLIVVAFSQMLVRFVLANAK